MKNMNSSHHSLFSIAMDLTLVSRFVKNKLNNKIIKKLFIIKIYIYYLFIYLQSSSSTESDSLPFANENAGTIKQRVARVQEYGNNSPNLSGHMMGHHQQHHSHHHHPQHHHHVVGNESGRDEPADVLNDIGNMLANLTDELDAMLEEEKRQGLNS